jgi:two-component system, NarL family, response regulator NreC
MCVTIVLADDHDVVRQGLRLLLETQEDLHVVAEAAEGLETVKIVEALHPSVLVGDLMMPDMNGLEVARRVRQQTPATQVVILSMYSDEAYVLEALRSGAAAYVLKGSSATCLLQGVREAYAGRRYLSPPLSQRAIEAYMTKAQEAPLDSYETLTARERQVLHLSVRGQTNLEIASALFISPRTVETHRSNLMRKLNLRMQADLIRYALRRGILRWSSSVQRLVSELLARVREMSLQLRPAMLGGAKPSSQVLPTISPQNLLRSAGRYLKGKG